MGLVAMLGVQASAQVAAHRWRVTGIGVAEMDGQYPYLLLGIGAGPGGRGVSPIIGVQGSTLAYNGGLGGRTTVFDIKPYVGLSDDYGTGDLYGDVGYSYSSKNTPIVTPSSNDIGRGVVVSGGWDHWGDGTTPWAHQLLGSYNFDAKSFWGRGRETRRIWQNGAAQRRLGGEVAYLSGEGYSAWQPGAVLEIHNAAGVIIGLGAGAKFQNPGNTTAYAKIEAVMPVIR